MRWIGAFLLLATINLPALAAGYLTYRDGVEEYDRANFEAAFATFQRLAESGDARSQYALGQLYSLGEGVKQDLAAAAKWFRKAANQGIVPAQFSLADLYSRGQGVEQSDVEAYMWYSLSAALARNREQSALARSRRGQVAKRMTLDGRADALRRACAWWHKYRVTPPGPDLGGCAVD